MDTIYAFTDEYGSHGFNFDADGNTTFFIITAIIVKESKVNEVELGIDIIRKKFFGEKGEIKSKSVNSPKRRNEILKSLLELDFRFYSLVVDKRKIKQDSGLMYKPSFYKYLNRLLYDELRRYYKSLVIISDKFGRDTYMDSFKKYIYENCQSYLWEEFDFTFEDSKNNCIIQLADFISGTLSYMYEERKKSDSAYNYVRMLQPRLIAIDCWPKEFIPYIKKQIGRTPLDDIIAETALQCIETFIQRNEKTDNTDIENQVSVAKYLRFAVLNMDEYGYISAQEIIESYPEEKKIDGTYLRMNIISKLRDAGVIIASSAKGRKKGYKLPSSLNQLYDYINNTNSYIIPMLHRLRRCRQIILGVTNREFDVLNSPEYNELRAILDFKDESGKA